MLEKLDQIDWSKVHDFYGPAPDIPDFIRGLASENPDVRGEAEHFLFMKINHQGSVREAMIYVVPFYIELLQNPGPQDKKWLLRTLEGMVSESGHVSYGAFPDYYNKLRDIAKVEEEWHKKHPDHAELMFKIHELLYDYKDAFLELLDQSDDLEIQIQVPHLLGYFIEHRSTLAPLLKNQLEKQTDPNVKASILMALGFLLSFQLEESAYFESFLTEKNPSTLRLAGALALTRVAQTETPVSALDLLENALNSLNEAKQAFKQLPWRADLGEITRSLCFVGLERVHSLLPNLLKAYQNVTHFRDFGTALLHLVFDYEKRPDKPYETPQELTSEQIQVLTMFFNNPYAWGIGKSHSVHWTTWKSFGLPDNREEMGKLLGI